MSLLSDAFENFIVINKAIVNDGYGGYTTEWTEGAIVKGAMVLDSSTLARMAEVTGVKDLYTLTVRKEVELDFHTVIKRVSDNKIFRLTTDSDDKKTPKSAGLNMRQYQAEEWSLPNGQSTGAT